MKFTNVERKDFRAADAVETNAVGIIRIVERSRGMRWVKSWAAGIKDV